MGRQFLGALPSRCSRRGKPDGERHVVLVIGSRPVVARAGASPTEAVVAPVSSAS